MTAEYQLWESAARRERKRVDDQHARAKQLGKKSDAKYSPERAAKPWSWSPVGPGPLFDLDDWIVSTVDSFDYDLDDKGFVDFLDRIAQLHICRKKDCSFWKLLQHKTTTRADFFGNSEMQYAQELNGECYRYSEKELEVHYRIFVRTRVYLQGAYDAYVGRETKPLDHSAYSN